MRVNQCAFCHRRKQIMYAYKRSATPVCWNHFWMLYNMDICDLSQMIPTAPRDYGLIEFREVTDIEYNKLLVAAMEKS